MTTSKTLFSIIILFILYLTITIPIRFHFRGHSVSIRPIRLQIVDARSGSPIRNMKVDYKIFEIHYVAPHLPALYYNTYMETIEDNSEKIRQTKYTDANGIVEFKNIKVDLERRDYAVERLQVEDISINFKDNDKYEVDMRLSGEFEPFNRKWKAFGIMSGYYEEYAQGGLESYDNGDCLRIENGLRKKSEAITVKLKRNNIKKSIHKTP